MIGLIMRLLGAVGVSERFQRLLAWVSLAMLAIGLLWALKASIEDAAVDRHVAKELAQSVKGHNAAADARASDTIENTINERNLHDAIDTAPTGSAVSDPARALACQRLQNHGIALPSECGREGADRDEAPADRRDRHRTGG